MKLPSEGARWLISLRWLASASVFVVIWLTSSLLGVIDRPLPLYVVACAMLGYNLVLWLNQRGSAKGEGNVDRQIFLQVAFDLTALTLLLYFADLPHNPFLIYYVFHMIIAGMYLRGSAPYFFAAMATVLVGGLMLSEHLGWIYSFPMRFPSHGGLPQEPPPLDALALLGVFVAFASSLWITVYFTTSIRRYVDRAHAEIRQKEKMLGIGQLVAGIAHQIANPLDGVQNCLSRVGERVKDDAHLTEYVQMMAEALDRIERTATRVQAFARPHGITLQNTDVNAAVEATLGSAGRRTPGQHPHRQGTGRRGGRAGRSIHAAGGALQPVHQRPGRHAPRRHAHAPHLCPGQQGRGPDGLGGHRRERHGGGHSRRRPGEDLRALLHHPRRLRRHRAGPGAVPHVDLRDGRADRGPQRPGPGHHLHRGPQPRRAANARRRGDRSSHENPGRRRREDQTHHPGRRPGRARATRWSPPPTAQEAWQQLAGRPLRRGGHRPENAQARRHRAAEADQAGPAGRHGRDHDDRLRQHPGGRRGGESWGPSISSPSLSATRTSSRCWRRIERDTPAAEARRRRPPPLPPPTSTSAWSASRRRWSASSA